MTVFLVVAGTFLLCWLFDKGFSFLFRNRVQHLSGKTVRLNKFFSLGGLLLITLGVFSFVVGISQSLVLMIGGAVVFVVGVFLAVYYLGFGVFYDEETFLFSTVGKKSVQFRYRDIIGQQLYRNGGRILIELYLKDGKTVQLQDNMVGVFPFLDAAFTAWCRQKNMDPNACEFHDPENCCWFPKVEG